MPQKAITRRIVGTLIGLVAVVAVVVWLSSLHDGPTDGPEVARVASQQVGGSSPSGYFSVEVPALPSRDVGPLPSLADMSKKRDYALERSEHELEQAAAFEQAITELEVARTELTATEGKARQIMQDRIDELRARAQRHRERSSIFLGMVDPPGNQGLP